MTLRLKLSFTEDKKIRRSVEITGSKSETNRALLLRALYPAIEIENLSNSDDGDFMQQGISKESGVVDIHHAGTAMRFLTAYFACQPDKEVLLTGSERMKQRPIGILVGALRDLGADIEYVGEEGYPPLKIKGRKLDRSKVSLPAHISSQYISALLLIAPALDRGIELELVGEMTSVPYIRMSLGLLEEIGVKTSFVGNVIKVAPKERVDPCLLVVGSDWSSASYYSSIAALSEPGTQIRLSSYKKDSLQGDSVLAEIYADFGVRTSHSGQQILLEKTGDALPSEVEYDLTDAPDIAQTIAVSCMGLGMGCQLHGLHTLPIKETDRLAALDREMSKFGARVSTDGKSLALQPLSSLKAGVEVDTYNDHRMAMAFAPLALKT